MSLLSVSLFGSVKVLWDGNPVNNFRYDKVRALLAYLATESHTEHPRDVLVGLFWPDLPQQAALTNLRQALANLRQVTHDHASDPSFLIIRRESIRWNPGADSSVDVLSFNKFVAQTRNHAHRSPLHCKTCLVNSTNALDLYHGAFLSNFFLPDSAPFEEWAAIQRESFQRQAGEALSRLTDFHEQRGEFTQAVAYARRHLELEPWREEIHRQLMRLLVLSDQRSAAISQYENCRRILAAELGLDPEPETSALYEQICVLTEDKGIENSFFLSKGKDHHLPYQVTPFVGRENELSQIGGLLAEPESRLITITGAGGMGKTRLALQAATEQQGAYLDGAWFVPLSGFSSPELLSSVIAQHLEIPLSGEEEVTKQLLKYLAKKDLLLVLDNFEHLLEGADLISEILSLAPQVDILVTSRERLRLQGEWVFVIEGLRLPEETVLENLEAYEAVQLFLQGARRAHAASRINEADKPFIARICRLLDGTPLAIELASAWTRTLSPSEIVQEIEKDLNFLDGSLRGVPERHQSLQAIFEHSWSLLSQQEQDIFRRLSVFRRGFNRGAAEQVAEGKLSMLGALLDKSLLVRSPNGRYELHEISRQYAQMQQTASGEENLTRDRHLEYFLQLAEKAQPELEGKDGAYWLRGLEEENDNLRAALEWSLESGDILSGLRLVIALYRFWYWHSHFSEGTHWFEAILKAASLKNPPLPPALLAKALHAYGVLSNERGSLDQALLCYQQSLALRREIDDKSGQAACLNSLGAIAFDRQDYERAEKLFEESLSLRREIGQKESLFVPLTNLGLLAQVQKNYERARHLLEESLDLQRRMGNKASVVHSLADLAWVVLLQGDHSYAQALFSESLSLSREIGDLDGVSYALEGMAGVLSSNGGSTEAGFRAAKMFGAAEALRESINSPLSLPEKAEYEPKINQIRQSLGDHTFREAWNLGRQIINAKQIEAALFELLPE